MEMTEAKPGDALVFLGFNGDEEEYEKILHMGFSVGVMVIVKEVKGDKILVEFEDGKTVEVDWETAKKIEVNKV